MDRSQNIGSTKNEEELKWIDQKYVTYIYILVGVLLLFVVPYGMTMKGSAVNNYVLIINTIFSLYLIGIGIVEYLNIRKSVDVLAKYFPLVIIISGFITAIMYSHFYDTGWDKSLHLYIVNISSAGLLHIAYYKARDVISETSSVGGLLVILGGIYEVMYRRMKK